MKEHTRFRNEQSSRLDLIFTKEENDVKNVEILTPLGRSDHARVSADFVSEWKSRVVLKPRRMYSKGKYGRIIRELNLVDWDCEFLNKSVQECWDIFKSKLEVLVEKYIPMSSPKDFNEPWMNNSIMKICKNKYQAWKRYTETKSYHRYQVYRKEVNLLKKCTRQAKRLYEKKLAEGVRHNKRAFFRYVNSKLS